MLHSYFPWYIPPPPPPPYLPSLLYFIFLLFSFYNPLPPPATPPPRIFFPSISRLFIPRPFPFLSSSSSFLLFLQLLIYSLSLTLFLLLPVPTFLSPRLFPFSSFIYLVYFSFFSVPPPLLPLSFLPFPPCSLSSLKEWKRQEEPARPLVAFEIFFPRRIFFLLLQCRGFVLLLNASLPIQGHECVPSLEPSQMFVSSSPLGVFSQWALIIYRSVVLTRLFSCALVALH